MSDIKRMRKWAYYCCVFEFSDMYKEFGPLLSRKKGEVWKDVLNDAQVHFAQIVL